MGSRNYLVNKPSAVGTEGHSQGRQTLEKNPEKFSAVGTTDFTAILSKHNDLSSLRDFILQLINYQGLTTLAMNCHPYGIFDLNNSLDLL